MNASIKLYDGRWTNVPSRYYKRIRVRVDPITEAFRCVVTTHQPPDHVFDLHEKYGRVISTNQMHNYIVFVTVKNYIFIVKYDLSVIELAPRQNGIPRMYGCTRIHDSSTFSFVYGCDNTATYKYTIDTSKSYWVVELGNSSGLYDAICRTIYDIVNVTHENQKNYKERMYIATLQARLSDIYIIACDEN